MNRLDALLLRWVLLPAALFRRMGVDVERLRALLVAKLTIDNRRPSAFRLNGLSKRNRSERSELRRATLTTLLTSFLSGLILLSVLAVGVDEVTKLTLYLTLYVSLMGMTLMTDFAPILMDLRDNYLLLTKPISDRTFLAARLLHIGIRTAYIMVPAALPLLVAGVIGFGWSFVLPMVFVFVWVTLFCLFLVYAVYLVALRWFSPVRFQRLLGSLQVAIAVAMMLSWQLLPRLMESKALQGCSVQQLPWVHWLPPYWFSETVLFLSAKAELSVHTLTMVLLAVLVPLISAGMTFRFLAPSFTRKLGGMTEKGTIRRVSSARPAKGWERVAAWCTGSVAERAAFVFAVRMMGRSRDFKLRVYPSIGYILVFGVILLTRHPLTVPAADTRMAPLLLMVVYLCGMLVQTALMQQPFSEQYKAAWLFHVAPMERPGLIVSGALKAAVCLFYLPIVGLITVAGSVWLGVSVLPNLLLAGLNTLILAMVTVRRQPMQLPFTVPLSTVGGGNFTKSLMQLLLPLTVGFAHWWLSGQTVGMIVWLLVDLPLIAWLFRSIARRGISRPTLSRSGKVPA
jgi:hypothetical protein